MASRLARVAFDFVLAAQAPNGRCRNRMDRDGRWTDRPRTDDCWGRSVWALGAAATGHTPASRAIASEALDRALRQRSRWRRSMAFAALGAAEVLTAEPEHRGSRALLIDSVSTIGVAPPGTWAWPEPRLTYANATIAEAMIAAGAALERDDVLTQGLAMLTWLLRLETSRGHLSVTGVGGRGPLDRGPQFDQQPIEAAALADACWRAHHVTGDGMWSAGVAAAAGWFAGDNDTGASLRDERSGGCYDGLQAEGVNLNQGAESTLALVSTMQRAQSLVSGSGPAMTSQQGAVAVNETGVELTPDQGRVITRFFVPGHEDVGRGDSSRAKPPTTQRTRRSMASTSPNNFSPRPTSGPSPSPRWPVLPRRAGASPCFRERSKITTRHSLAPTARRTRSLSRTISAAGTRLPPSRCRLDRGKSSSLATEAHPLRRLPAGSSSRTVWARCAPTHRGRSSSIWLIHDGSWPTPSSTSCSATLPASVRALANLFVAAFIGSPAMNLFPGRLEATAAGGGLRRTCRGAGRGVQGRDR